MNIMGQFGTKKQIVPSQHDQSANVVQMCEGCKGEDEVSCVR